MLGRHWQPDQGHLAYYKDKGVVSTDVVKGRSNDVTVAQQLKQFGLDPSQEKDRVKLHYTDKQGNQLTIKQAFRELSRAFHGKGPSHRKLMKE